MDGRDFLRVALVGALLCVGCTSDETTICERLSECQLLPEGYSEDNCKRDAGLHVEDDRLDQCAECVTEKGCDQITDGCREFCEPIY